MWQRWMSGKAAGGGGSFEFRFGIAESKAERKTVGNSSSGSAAGNRLDCVAQAALLRGMSRRPRSASGYAPIRGPQTERA